MDKIVIEDLEVFAFHGVYEEEKRLGQKFLISLELSLDLKKAAVGDSIYNTINYGEVCVEVERVFKEKKQDLIESAAHNVLEYLLLKYPLIKELKIKIKKPWAPILKPLKYAAVELSRKWHKVYIGMGSNMGDKKNNLQEAINLINENKLIKVNKVSSFYDTKPFGYTEQEDFINCACEINTILEPKELMDFLLSVEKQLKRERVIRWGPRTIDLDILLFDEIVSSDPDIVIPHPGMHERDFVLKPLNEIAPYAYHPLKNKRIFELLNEV